MQSGVEVLIDWLTFTVKTDNPREVIKDWLGMDSDLFEEQGFGLMGYQRSMKFSDILICYEGRENSVFPDMGVCVSMSGNGCRSFETMSKLTVDDADAQESESVAFLSLFRMIAASDRAHVTRLDVSCDDKKEILPMDEIIRCVMDNDINSRSTRRSVVFSYAGQGKSGATAYIGAPSSDFRVRIYDKALEQGVSGPWIRVEMVMRRKHADAFVNEAAANKSTIGRLAAGVLNDKLAFIERDDSNISRCTVLDWWQNFINTLESVHLVARKVIQHSVFQIAEWVRCQIGPSLGILAKTMGYSQLAVYAEEGFKRLSAKQMAIVDDWNALREAVRSQGLPVPVVG